MNRSLRIAVAEDERDTREYLQDLLVRLGHQVVAAGTGRQLLEQCRILDPDLIITDIKMPELDGIAAADAVNRERETPVILVSGHHSPDLIARAAAGNIMAYLIKPIQAADVEAAIALAMTRFEQYRAARREADELKQTLEDRKIVERAKGVLIKRLRLDEPEAYRRLRRLATDQSRRLVEVARTVLGAEDIFAQLDRP